VHLRRKWIALLALLALQDVNEQRTQMTSVATQEAMMRFASGLI
jgi:hypothetical protein